MWETGRPQLEVVALADAGEIEGVVLDAGCGTGENAIYLARRKRCRVIGVDFVPRAIEIARSKAVARGAEVEFAVCDVRSLPFSDDAFDTALDSGLFHVFSDDGKATYARRLRAVVRLGGLFHVIVWSEQQPGGEGPARVSRAQLRRYFAEGWDCLGMKAGVYETVIHGRGAKAWVASFRRNAR